MITIIIKSTHLFVLVNSSCPYSIRAPIYLMSVVLGAGPPLPCPAEIKLANSRSPPVGVDLGQRRRRLVRLLSEFGFYLSR